MQKVEFTVPGDVNELSPNVRLHHMKRARLVREWREKAHVKALADRVLPFSGKVRVSFHIQRGRRLDECNAVGSSALKAIVDGLVDARVLRQDTPDYVQRGFVTQDGARHFRGREQVIVTIEEAE